MNRSQRQWHRRIWCVLGLLLLIGLFASVYFRPASITPTATELSDER